tara:strand:+ start:183 stop:1286 length:1104 start_codon:yes stop_codon:yes gene_type:complete
MNTGLHILTLEELGKTGSLLTKWKALTGPHGDIYYDLTYLRITEVLDGGKILLALFAHALGNVVYPFVLRPISGPTIDVKPGAGLFDIITPFEFGGPLFIGDDRHRCLVQSAFMTQFDNFCAKENVVSEFVRFHPLLNNQVGWDDWYDINASCQNVTIDLTQDNEEIFKNLRNNHRRNIKSAEQKKRVVEKIAVTPETSNIFQKLYFQAMDELGAKPYYYFPKAYFTGLTRIESNKIFLYAIKDHLGGFKCGGLFIGAGRFCHYHLGAMTDEARNQRLGSLLFYKAAIDLKHSGYSLLHLGGAAVAQTGLMHFKEGFSKTRVPYYCGRRIHHEHQYESLCGANRLMGYDETKPDFFPAYRSEQANQP